MPTIPIEVTIGCPVYASCCSPSVVRKMLGVFANAVELGTMPTIRNVRAPTGRSSPIWRSSVLDTATSAGVDGARPSETPGMPGPCSGAPNAVVFRVDVPSLIVDAAVASGAAATIPGSAATRARSTCANGVDPKNGPAAPDLTTNESTPMESTVRCASTRKPLASPVRTSVIAKTNAVLRIAMTRRRLRHCMSRRAADSMLATLPMTRHFRAWFGHVCSPAGCHGIASAQAMCPSKPSDAAMSR